MYTTTNYKTKKALKEAVANGERVTVFRPGPFPGETNGPSTVEGPHYPEPHRGYAAVTLSDSVITAVK